VRVASPVAAVLAAATPGGPVTVAVVQGKEAPAEEYDAVVLATHSDVSLRMLGAQGPQVRGTRAGMGDGGRWMHALAAAHGVASAPRYCISVTVLHQRHRRAHAHPELSWALRRCFPLPRLPTVQALKDVLAAIPYNDNDVWLHTDASLMPRCRKTWASWNFLGRSGDDGQK
jgi:hypothetical protein